MALQKHNRPLLAEWPHCFCGPFHAHVRTSRDQIEDALKSIEQSLTKDPALLERVLAFQPLTPKKSPENAGWANIRHINWERRVKRLKKDWYEK